MFQTCLKEIRSSKNQLLYIKEIHDFNMVISNLNAPNLTHCL